MSVEEEYQHSSGGEREYEALCTFLLINQEMGVGVDADDDRVGEQVDSSDEHQGLRIFQRDSLGDLHHHKDDNQVGPAHTTCSQYNVCKDGGRLGGTNT